MKKIKVLILSFCILLYGCGNNNITNQTNNIQITPQVSEEKLAEIYFIDVGQADATLIISNDETMLIDTGDVDTKEDLLSYLQKLKINEIKYLILTHPHADHIGGAPTIINNIKINNILMPDKITSSDIFEQTIDAIDKNNYNITIPEQNEEYKIGNGNFKILTDQSIDWADDLNAYSIGIKLTFGNSDLIFTGDLEEKGEKTILNQNLDAEVLKAGHHGSSSSTSDNFLKAINPKITIISCGKDNSYGHPHKEIINKLENKNISYYRTDVLGTIKLNITANSINIDNGDNFSNNTVIENITSYILNTNSKKIHLINCSSVEKISEKNKKIYNDDISKLLNEGYEKCKICME